ncbi:MAG: hypothetical protein M2R45_04402 [Verrucomicrobia subdivision 3 bacterium]|nr:hypothetical protein [Limisphaerales bacterium]MCS1417260.1 hypothetical protein [Limisphaerales bacterium]
MLLVHVIDESASRFSPVMAMVIYPGLAEDLVAESRRAKFLPGDRSGHRSRVYSVSC